PQAVGTRVAAVNSFGIGGLNVHLVVEQYHSKIHGAKTGEIKVKSPEAVAVVGLGCVLPGAFDAQSLSALLRAPNSHVQEPPASRWPSVLPTSLSDHAGKASLPVRAGFVKGYEFDWRSSRIPPKQVQNAN